MKAVMNTDPKIKIFSMIHVRQILRKVNRVRKSVLSFYQKQKTQRINDEFIDAISNRCGGLEGKKILEVGAGQDGLLITRIIGKYKAEEAIGINLVTYDQTLLNSCKIIRGDIRKTDFLDNYFDIIISSSVFEHIQNIDIAINEMYRVLKPGGFLYSHFGPIWSTSYGHHLYMSYNSKLYNYWNFILPPYCHLLLSPDELLEYCFNKTSNEELSKSIVKYIYESQDQNRLMYEDYERIICASKFEVIFLKGYDHPILSAMYTSIEFPKTMKLLRDKFPDYNNFLYDGITVLLKKPVQD